MSTTSEGIPLYDSTNLVQLDALLNGQSNALNAALVAQNLIIAGLQGGSNLHRGTASQRVAALASLADGVMWMDTDGAKLLYVRQSAQWVAYPSGSMSGTIASASGTTLTDTSFVSKRADGVVEFLVGASRSGWTANGTTLLATLPSGYRPTGPIGLSAAMNGATAPNVKFAQVEANGAISLHTSPTNGQSWTATVQGAFKTA